MSSHRGVSGMISVDNNVYTELVSTIVKEIGTALQAGAKVKFTELSNRLSRELGNAYSDCNSHDVVELLSRANELVSEVYESARCCFSVVMLIELELTSRLTLHTRNPYTPLEIGIAWHPFLNLPFIPATTIKGLLRAYVEENALKQCNMGAEELFGRGGEHATEGLLVVTDAFPVGCKNRLIELDIITPHYREPTSIIDEVRAEPTPLVYPVLAPGTQLRLVIALRKIPDEAKCVVKELPGLLNKALSWGLGARTSLGYGLARARLVNSYWRFGVQR